ncbi:hypothetical protein [Pontibacillus salicampi]
MVKQAIRKESVECLVCSHQFDVEAPLDKEYEVSSDSVHAEAVATGTMTSTGSDGKLVNIMVYAACPSCGVTNQIKEVL